MKKGLSLGLAASIAAFGLASGALAVVNCDGASCDPGVGNIDCNGGCNVTGNPFQDLGNIALSNINIPFSTATTTITGSIGTYTASGATSQSSRDLDWYSFTLTEGRQVTFTLTTSFASGGTDNVLFIGPAPDCAAVGGQPTFYAQQLPSPQSVSYYLPAGTYTLIATSPFEADAVNPPFEYNCGTYTLDITTTTTEYGTLVCNGTGLQGCDVAHAGGGCDDYGCCEAVIAADPLCADNWDASCVQGAVDICGYFIYTCNATANSPANDCLTAPQTVVVGGTPVTVNFDTTNAKTDGPSNACTGAATLMGKDVWYLVKAPSDGQLTVSGCAGITWDSVFEVYGIGTSPVVDTNILCSQFIGQVDDTCGTTAGPSTFTLVGAVKDEYYLVRIGGFDTDGLPATQNDIANGAGQLVFTYQSVIYATSAQKFVVAVSGGANTNLGLSSGALSAAQPRRWYASPFTVGATGAGFNAWEIQEIVTKGFDANAASTPIQNVNWIIWKRTGFNKPVDGDQVLSGSVPAPVPFDDPLDSAANASWPLTIPAGTKICPGDYYLTTYGQRTDDPANGGTSPANLAWFIYNTSGINIVDANGLHGWRAANFPSPGFVVYTGLNGAYVVQAGDDPNDLYNVCYSIVGIQSNSAACTAPCPADLNGDGQVNAADLGILLGGWGGNAPGAALAAPTNVIDAADLGVLLGGWGACP